MVFFLYEIVCLQSRDALIDNDEEEELEQYALSDFWRFEEDHRRWSRLDSKASSIGSPTLRSTNAVQKPNAEGLNEVRKCSTFYSIIDAKKQIHLVVTSLFAVITEYFESLKPSLHVT